jgi:biopolymer transport protein ExbD
MINVRRSLRGGLRGVDINMGPLIDMVFLLLIFFVVTTSFVKESGIDVERPTAATAEMKEKGNVLIGIAEDGSVYLDRKRIDVRSVRAHMARVLAENPESSVVVVADRKSQTGVVVQVMDQCRLAGTKNVSLAASKAKGDE